MMYHWECPECEASDTEFGALATETQIYCGVCAGDTGRDVLLNRTPASPAPAAGRGGRKSRVSESKGPSTYTVTWVDVEGRRVVVTSPDQYGADAVAEAVTNLYDGSTEVIIESTPPPADGADVAALQRVIDCLNIYTDEYGIQSITHIWYKIKVKDLERAKAFVAHMAGAGVSPSASSVIAERVAWAIELTDAPTVLAEIEAMIARLAETPPPADHSAREAAADLMEIARRLDAYSEGGCGPVAIAGESLADLAVSLSAVAVRLVGAGEKEGSRYTTR